MRYQSQLKETKSTKDITKIVLFGSILVNILLLLLLIMSFAFVGNQHVEGRIVVGLIVLAYLGIVTICIFNSFVRIGAWMMVCLYAAIGLLIVHLWGLNAPVGILFLGFVIILGGVLLGASHIIGITVGIILSLVVVQLLTIVGISQPDISTLDNNSTFGDVAGYSVIFGILALLTWLSGTRMERILERAIEAEKALQLERDSLVFKVAEQTKSLRMAHEKELKQLYVFAELGQLTTIILHELANQLSVLALDIDDLDDRDQSSLAISRARESIFYIDTIIEQVRGQIRETDDIKRFNTYSAIKETQRQLSRTLTHSNIRIGFNNNMPKKYIALGDPFRLTQALTILITNAYQANDQKDSEILVSLSSNFSHILLSVRDFGTGISPEARMSLFEPLKSKKGSGMGIGLYITKQIIVTHFKGTISLDKATTYTQFNIKIPLAKT